MGAQRLYYVLSFFLVPLIGVTFMQMMNRKWLSQHIVQQPGQTREEAEEIALDAETLISNREGVTTYQYLSVAVIRWVQ